MEAARAPSSEKVIKPPSGVPLPDLRELWEHRDLLYFMARRDVAIRYNQAAVGILWALIQPLVLAAVFTVFLGILGNLEGPAGIPYPLYTASGLIMWLFLAGGLQSIAGSTVTASSLISKVYFPRLVIPIASVAPALLDFLFGFAVIVGVAAAYGFWPQPELLLLPLVLVLAVAAVLGVGFWLSALNVRYRDVILLVPFLTQIGLFITPIFYPLSIVPDEWQWAYALNPAVGVVESYRWIVLGTDFPELVVAISAAVSAFLLVTGAIYFRKAEEGFADVI